MTKLAKEFRRLNLEELDKKEAELKLGLIRANVYRGIPTSKEAKGEVPIRKTKRILALIKTIKNEKLKLFSEKL